MFKSQFLTTEEVKFFLKLVRSHVERHGICKKANALLLLNKGVNFSCVAEMLFIDEDTVRQWHKCFTKEGWPALITDKRGGREGHLNKTQIKTLIKWAYKEVPSNIKHVITFINRHFGVFFSRSGAIKLMNRLGFEYTKPKRLPAIADEEAQEGFIKSYNNLQNNLKDDEMICFVDAVHPEYQTRQAYGWLKKGIKHAVRCTTGRKRTNIHGALCLENGNIVFTNTDTVDAQSTVSLLTKIENANKDKKTIHVILDNARYHHAKIVKEWLNRSECRIKLMFLPPYCPHLNSIERLWGVMHTYVTHNKYYERYDLFYKAVILFLKDTVPNVWKDIRDTVSDNFRIISYKNFRVLK